MHNYLQDILDYHALEESKANIIEAETSASYLLLFSCDKKYNMNIC